MKKLYVGCRVRILWSNWHPEINGTDGVIIGKTEGRCSKGFPNEWVVEVSAWGSHLTPSGRRFCPASNQLEPIQPEGMQHAAWADCLWSPESGFRHDKLTA